jgi:hypothetical protein
VWTAADQGLIAWTEDPAGRHGRADRFGERVLDGIVARHCINGIHFA